MNEMYFKKFSRAIRLGSVCGIRFASGNELFWQLSLLYSHSVVSDSLRLHGVQHTRLPCFSPSLRACSNSCPFSQWCHPTTTSSVISFSCLISFPASGSFPVNWLFISGGQSTEASVSASVLPMNIHGWFPSWWTRLISMQSKGLPRLFSNTTTESINSSALSLLYDSSHIHIRLLERSQLWLYGPLSAK